MEVFFSVLGSLVPSCGAGPRDPGDGEGGDGRAVAALAQSLLLHSLPQPQLQGCRPRRGAQTPLDLEEPADEGGQNPTHGTNGTSNEMPDRLRRGPLGTQPCIRTANEAWRDAMEVFREVTDMGHEEWRLGKGTGRWGRRTRSLAEGVSPSCVPAPASVEERRGK